MMMISHLSPSGSGVLRAVGGQVFIGRELWETFFLCCSRCLTVPESLALSTYPPVSRREIKCRCEVKLTRCSGEVQDLWDLGRMVASGEMPSGCLRLSVCLQIAFISSV